MIFKVYVKFVFQATVTLYKISDASGKVSSVKIAEKPLQQSLLDSNVRNYLYK